MGSASIVVVIAFYHLRYIDLRFSDGLVVDTTMLSVTLALLLSFAYAPCLHSGDSWWEKVRREWAVEII